MKLGFNLLVSIGQLGVKSTVLFSFRDKVHISSTTHIDLIRPFFVYCHRRSKAGPPLSVSNFPNYFRLNSAVLNKILRSLLRDLNLLES